MSGWQSFIFDDPNSGQPMLPLVVQVMRCIYHVVNPACPPPSTVDSWWHSQSLSYKVDESGLEPSIVILNLREGESDCPTMKTHFMINLNTMRVHDKFRDNRFPAPQEIIPVLREIKDYVRRTLQGNKEAQEACQREEVRLLEKAREDKRNRVQAFYDCLVEKCVIDEEDAKQFSSDSVECPVCSGQQMSCSVCQVISCSNTDCEASFAIPILQCSDHTSKSFCTSCLESPAEGSLPRMGQCPICMNWRCSEGLTWCIGRPILISSDDSTNGTEPSSSNIDVLETTRLHGARPLSCWSRDCISKSAENQTAGRRCSNSACWSAPGNTSVCPECVEQDGFSCPCGRYWACGSCVLQACSAHIFTCPRCEQIFCPWCSYIRACESCMAVGLCNDCIEEEGDERCSQGADIVLCSNCQGQLCGRCAEVDSKSCHQCGRGLCKQCVGDFGICECNNCGSVYDDPKNYDYGYLDLELYSDNGMAW